MIECTNSFIKYSLSTALCQALPGPLVVDSGAMVGKKEAADPGSEVGRMEGYWLPVLSLLGRFIFLELLLPSTPISSP